MANVVQLKHLEHLEDEMLNYGVEGCHAAVRFMRELIKMLGTKKGSGYLQTKWDGSPSIVCGIDPDTKNFFVANKSAFNVGTPKIAFNYEEVDSLYGTGGLGATLKTALRYFSQMNIQGVVQGDVIFVEDKVKTEVIDGERLVTFRLNTLTYAVPYDQPLAQQILRAKIGIVFHTHYEGDKIESMRALAGANVPNNNDLPEVVQLFNDTPLADTAIGQTTLSAFARNVEIINRMCSICGKFLDNLVSNMGTTGNAKYHIASYLKQFFNDEVKKQNTIDPTKAFKDLGKFYHTKMTAVIDKLKSPAAKTDKRNLMYAGLKYLEDNEREFKAMLALYKKIQENKQLVIDELDRVENLGPIKYFVKTSDGYKVTNPEGYVLHLDGDMIKLVNRLEFSYNNFTVEKDWK
jgi:DNA-binding transcriptional regulator YhcF (GntR family)